jgi:hypothetical protein
MNPRKRPGMGRGAIPSVLSPDAELRVMTLRDVADYLHCHYSPSIAFANNGRFPASGLVVTFLKSETDEWIAKGGGRPSGRPAAKTDGGRRGRKPKRETTKS